MYNTCGYDGVHGCGRGVYFISRYRDETDFCVNGHRVHVYDDGHTSGTPAEIQSIVLHELTKYGEYAIWNAEHRAKDATWPTLEAFRYGHLQPKQMEVAV